MVLSLVLVLLLPLGRLHPPILGGEWGPGSPPGPLRAVVTVSICPVNCVLCIPYPVVLKSSMRACSLQVLVRSKFLMALQKKMPRSNATEHASSTAAEHATRSNATEHAIVRWQAQVWRSSKDCQHVIQVLLSLQAKEAHQHLQVQNILVRNLPSFFVPSRAVAFLNLLQQKTITDVSLRDSLVDFLARWEFQHEASYQELLADTAVAREAHVLLPRDIPMCWWIKSRLHGEIDLVENERGTWTLRLLPKSILLKQIVIRYKARNAVVAQV